MARQGGLITRAQAVQAGCTERELRTATGVHGPWVVVRRGVYADRLVWEASDDDGQWALRDRAAHLTMNRKHVLSHDSAARVHGLPLLRGRRPVVHVTRPGVEGTRTEHGVCHHLTRTWSCATEVDGLPVTDLARTALDLGREHGISAGVVACDVALRRVPASTLEQRLSVMTCWPHVTRARAAFLLADPGADSPGESLGRLLVLELGLGRPETQFPVRIGAGVAWCDLRLGRHIFEFDGRIKYQGRDEGGVADRPASQVVWDEKKRERLIYAEGLGVSRITWDDLWGPARRTALARLRSDVQQTRERYGDELPAHLAEFAHRMRGRRRAG